MSKFDGLLDITENKIIAKHDNTTVHIDLKEFADDIVETSTHYNTVGVFDINIESKKEIAPIIFNYMVKLMKTDDMIIDKSDVIITYKKGEVICTGTVKNNEVGVTSVVKLLNSRSDFVKDPTILVLLLHEKLPNIDLVHLETIVSNMNRVADDNSLQARHHPSKESVILGNIKLASINSTLSSLAFRNIRKSIDTSLITTRKNKPNAIDNMISATL